MIALGWSTGTRILRWLINTALMVGAFYVLAGRWDLPWLWATAAVGSLVGLPLVLTIDPDLVKERRRPGPGAVDRASQVFIAVAVGAQIIVACLDVGRLHWSDTVPAALHVVGLVLFAAGFGLVTWSLAVNRFFSSVVRIRSERGHQIISTGPYGHVRHPGYLGMLVGYPVMGLAIGSWWALIPGALSFAVVLRRAVLEDRYLLERLAGYRDYAGKVRSRLIPGVW